MNKRYMDFSPVKSKPSQKAPVRPAVPTKPVARPSAKRPTVALPSRHPSPSPVRPAAVSRSTSSVRPTTTSRKAPIIKPTRPQTPTSVRSHSTLTAPKSPIKRTTIQLPQPTPHSSRPLSTKSQRIITAASTRTPVPPRTIISSSTISQSNSSKFSIRSHKVELGKIEDLDPKFIKTNVEKRPLSAPAPASPATPSSPKAAKSKKLIGKFRTRSTKASPKTPTKSTTPQNTTFHTPSSPFINQDKVEKRPLSKNLYPKKKIPTSEPSTGKKGPVTIITKPTKESHVGIIVTIILTIIFGAIAGTVAFLLLPK